jgi:hypothetical protein
MPASAVVAEVMSNDILNTIVPLNKSQRISDNEYRNHAWFEGETASSNENVSYADVINFKRSSNPRGVAHHCVMCGDINAIIPSQNKDVCKTCDTGFWLLIETQIVIKFCKGCKNFARLHEFRDKPEATKCIKCRQRGRLNYFSKKMGEGECEIMQLENPGSSLPPLGAGDGNDRYGSYLNNPPMGEYNNNSYVFSNDNMHSSGVRSNRAGGRTRARTLSFDHHNHVSDHELDDGASMLLATGRLQNDNTHSTSANTSSMAFSSASNYMENSQWFHEAQLSPRSALLHASTGGNINANDNTVQIDTDHHMKIEQPDIADVLSPSRRAAERAEYARKILSEPEVKIDSTKNSSVNANALLQLAELTETVFTKNVVNQKTEKPQKQQLQPQYQRRTGMRPRRPRGNTLDLGSLSTFARAGSLIDHPSREFNGDISIFHDPISIQLPRATATTTTTTTTQTSRTVKVTPTSSDTNTSSSVSTSSTLDDTNVVTKAMPTRRSTRNSPNSLETNEVNITAPDMERASSYGNRQRKRSITDEFIETIGDNRNNSNDINDSDNGNSNEEEPLVLKISLSQAQRTVSSSSQQSPPTHINAMDTSTEIEFTGRKRLCSRGDDDMLVE